MSKTFCPHCNQKYEVDESDFGREVLCESCMNNFVIAPVAQTSIRASIAKAKQRTCPMCGEAILDVAKICRHCRSILPDSKGNISIRNTDYILLAISLGWLGAHNFAVNQFIRGMIQIIALVFAFILFDSRESAFISFLFIALKSLMIVVDVVIGTEYK